MERPLRIRVVDGWHRVISRGKGGKTPVHRDDDRRVLLGFVSEQPERLGTEVHAFVYRQRQGKCRGALRVLGEGGDAVLTTGWGTNRPGGVRGADAGEDKTGLTQLPFEFKGSKDASLTNPNQESVMPDLEEYGGEIAGDEASYIGRSAELELGPTPVEVVRNASRPGLLPVHGASDSWRWVW